MRVLLMRHAACVDSGFGIGESERYLTSSGRDVSRRAGLILREREAMPLFVMTSSLVRAVQTAELVVAAAGARAEVRVSPVMMPGAPPTSFVDELGALDVDTLAVGHAPDMRRRAAALLGIAARDVPTFEKGMVLCVALSEAGATFEWAWRPMLDEVVETLAELRQ